MTEPKIALLQSVELTQAVVKTPLSGPPLAVPPGLMAISDETGHVLVRIYGQQFGMDTVTALRLLRDLRIAVDNSAGWPPTNIEGEQR